MKRIKVTVTTEYTPNPLYCLDDKKYTIEEMIKIYLDEVFSGNSNIRLEIVDDTESNGR